jgi:hypothetical protein
MIVTAGGGGISLETKDYRHEDLGDRITDVKGRLMFA